MVAGLKEGKETLQKAYVKSVRRALDGEHIRMLIPVLVILDVHGRILTINIAACSILNVNAEDVINKTTVNWQQ